LGGVVVEEEGLERREGLLGEWLRWVIGVAEVDLRSYSG